MWSMSELKELAIGILVVLLVLLGTSDFWLPLIPERFTVRYMLLAVTVVAAVLGICVIYTPR
jgi:hypothetical protein